jgi:hypothetical protein
VNGTFSKFTTGGWSTQALATGSLFSATRGTLLGELAGIAGGSANHDGTRTAQTVANIRLHSVRSHLGAFVGAGGGSAWDGITWRRLLLGELGAWIRKDAGMALLSIAPAAVDDTIRYLDGQLSVSRTVSTVDFSALAGGRAGNQSPGVGTRSKSWASLNVTAWVRPHLAVVAGGGTYPVDLTQGFPGGRFLSLGVRYAGQARAMPRSTPDAAGVPELEESGRPVIEAFQSRRTAADSVSLRVRASAATTVEITGDFSGWIPTRLEPAADGWWVLILRLAPGQYQMNVRVDGAGWIAPPGLLALKDEFGGTVGLLVVE